MTTNQKTQFESAEQVLEMAQQLRELGGDEPYGAVAAADMLGILLAKVMQLESAVLEAQAARDASNLAARAQNAKLMAMTDQPDGFKLLGDVLAKCAPAAVKRVKAERDAYKWGYTYLQDRMHSLDRHGWATDCDGEIEQRIEAARKAE